MFSSCEDKVKIARQFLVNEFLRNANFYFVSGGKYGEIEIVGHEEYIEHGVKYMFYTNDTPEEFKRYLKLGGKHKLDNKTIIKSEFFQLMIEKKLLDFAVHDWYAKFFNYNYLTTQDIYIRLINEVNNSDISTFNSSLYKTLSHRLPIITGISIQDILKVRKKEEEAFSFYRDSMKRLVREITLNGTQYSREAFMDIVNPEITKINMAIKESKLSTIINLGKNLAISSGLVYLGVSSGILPENLKELLPAVGAFDMVRASIKDVTNLVSKPKEIKENPYYFLWKLQR